MKGGILHHLKTQRIVLRLRGKRKKVKQYGGKQFQVTVFKLIECSFFSVVGKAGFGR
jgi:hypothetical protein